MDTDRINRVFLSALYRQALTESTMAKGAFLAVILAGAISVLGSPTTSGCNVLKGKYFVLSNSYCFSLVSTETFSPPREWVKQRPAPPDHGMTLRISLKQPNFNKLEEHLYAVSDPASPRYGQHLSKEQVQDLVAPSSHGLSVVNDWLASMGFNVHELVRSPSSDWVKVDTTVKQAEEMLNTVQLHHETNYCKLTRTIDISCLGTYPYR